MQSAPTKPIIFSKPIANEAFYKKLENVSADPYELTDAPSNISAGILKQALDPQVTENIAQLKRGEAPAILLRNLAITKKGRPLGDTPDTVKGKPKADPLLPALTILGVNKIAGGSLMVSKDNEAGGREKTLFLISYR